MARDNKKEAVAVLHSEWILQAGREQPEETAKVLVY